jgi:Protein of unknown function (DUF1064)
VSLKDVAEFVVANRYKSEVAKTKFRNVKVEIDGIRFDSKREGARYRELKLMEKAGMIRNLKLQVVFPIIINEQLVCKYIADFTFEEEVEFGGGKSWQTIVEDVKGMKTAVYQVKKRLMKAVRGITIRETR